MKWRKLGRVFEPKASIPLLHSHASIPIPVQVDDDYYKILFSYRNKDQKSLIGWVLVDIKNPLQILDLSQSPLLDLGEPGFFDEDGTMASFLLNQGNRQLLYYIGWNLSLSVPFRNSLGLAVSVNRELKFKKYSTGPILDRSIYDPCFVASNCVLFDHNIFKMWYLSCIKWERQDDKFKHSYHIKYAESRDGIEWERRGVVAIDFVYENEYAISRPIVLKENNIYKMWYSYRGGPRSELYRIGYAESEDGIKWIRMDDKAGIDVSPSGWDDEMICYPYVFHHKGIRYMLYNGNGYGKTGFGICIQEE